MRCEGPVLVVAATKLAAGAEMVARRDDAMSTATLTWASVLFFLSWVSAERWAAH